MYKTISEPGEPDIWRYVFGGVSPRTGSDVSISDIVCASETGDPVGCVRTGGMEGDDYGGTVALTWTGSGESVAGVICTTGPDGPVDGAAAGGTYKD